MGTTMSYLAVLGLLAFTSPLSAQTTESKRTLTLEGAKAVAAAAAAEAKRGNEGASIAIVDDGGNLMYLEHLENSEITWTPYTNLTLGLIGIGGNVTEPIH